MQARFGSIALLSALLLILGVASCGSGTGNVGLNGPNLENEQNGRVTGVATGGFEVIRHNQQGNNDASLNPTLGLELRTEGNETALVISVDDSTFTNAVTLAIKYDAERYHAVRAEFTDLLGNSEQVLTGAFLDSHPGAAGIGAAVIGGVGPASLRGELATIWFAPGPDRMVSAAGDAHGNPAGVAEVLTNGGGLPNLVVDATTTPGTVSMYWTSAWMFGNGDGNKETNAADLVPISQLFQQRVDTNFAAIRADYDRNVEVNAADLVRISQNFQSFTDAYLVQASDDDGTGAVTIATIDGANQTPPAGPPAAGNLRSVFPSWEVVIGPATAFTFAQLQALDVNADTNVRISVTPLAPAGGVNGVTANTTVIIGTVTPPTNNMLINSLTVSVNDGAGTEIGVLDAANTSMTVEANASIGFTLESINGTYNGTPFTGRPAVDPTDEGQLTQAHYDAAFTAAEGFLITNITTGGDASARRSSEWLTFPTGSSPYLGILPATGTVFPDHDPESTLPNSAEGSLSFTLPISGGPLPGGGTADYPSNTELVVQVVGAPVVASFNFDVAVDPLQVEIPPYTVDNGGLGTSTELVLNRRNILRIVDPVWGTGGEPADFSSVDLELRRISATGLVTGPIVAFTYSTETNENLLAMGQFNILKRPLVGGGFETTVTAVVNTSALTQGANYALRMSVDGRFSTLNLPEMLLTTAPPPPPQPIMTIPAVLGGPNDQIQLFYEDTTIRRNGAMFATVGPPPDRIPFYLPADQAAYNDILRTDGDEFVPNIDTTVTPSVNYPVIVIKYQPDPANPIDISGPDDPDAEPGIVIIERGANRLVVDVAALTLGGGGPEDPPAYAYTFIIYGMGGVELGGGEFSYSPTFTFPSVPGDLAWGVNAANREAIDLADLKFDSGANPSIRVCDADFVGGPTPPVLFFKFEGGSPYDYNQDEEVSFGTQSPSTTNPYVYVENPLDIRPLSMYISARVAGLAPDGGYVMIHTITADDFDRIGIPAWPGILDPGNSYDMYLIDPASNVTRSKLPEMKFAEQLLVIGTNPWSP